MSTGRIRKERKNRKSKIDWEDVGRKLVSQIYGIVTDYCFIFERDNPLSCFYEHSKMDLYKIAELHNSDIWIPDELGADVLDLLRRMPRDIYERLNDELIKILKDIVESMVAEVKWECEDDCGNDRGCLERCYEKNKLPRELW